MKKQRFITYFFSICILLVLQNVITIAVNLADNVMLGAYSETSLSGVAAVNHIQFIYQMIVVALGDGLVMFGSQYWGKKQLAPMKKISAIALQSALFVSIVLFSVITLFPNKAIQIFTNDIDIINEGVAYINIIRFTYVFFALTQILLAIMRMVEKVKIAFALSIVTFFVNCGINSVLIFGRFGFPVMGVKGAAIGTLVARILEFIIIVYYVFINDSVISMKVKDCLGFDRILAKDYYKITIPMVVVQGLWGCNTALQTAILGHMTKIAIAANSVASNLFLLVKSMVVGASSTASVIIGKTIGENDIDRVYEYSSKMQRIFVCIGISGGIIIYLLRGPILSLYNLQPETLQMANAFLIVLSFVFVGTSYQMPTNNGIIRGGGSSMYVVKMDLISIWMIVLPLSFVMAFYFNASPVVVLWCLNADQFFKSIPAYIMSHHGNWIKKLTR